MPDPSPSPLLAPGFVPQTLTTLIVLDDTGVELLRDLGESPPWDATMTAWLAETALRMCLAIEIMRAHPLEGEEPKKGTPDPGPCCGWLGWPWADQKDAFGFDRQRQVFYVVRGTKRSDWE